MITKTNLTLPKIPYRGIESFRYVDQPIFFAREEETQKLLRYIMMYRGVLFYGDSGSGKSSLINAGLIPAAIEQDFLPHRLRVQPRSGEEFIVERISENDDGRHPYLPSVLTVEEDGPARVVLSIAALKEKLASFRIYDLIGRLAIELRNNRSASTREIRRHLTKETLTLIDAYHNYDVLSDSLQQALNEELNEKLRSINILGKSTREEAKVSQEVFEQLQSSQPGRERLSSNYAVLNELFPPEPRKATIPLLIFDQFEEFVTLFEIAPRGEELKKAQVVQQAILEILVEFIRDRALAINILFVFREDYLAKLTKLFVRCPDLTDQYLRLTPPRTNKLPRIIRGPFDVHPNKFFTEAPASAPSKSYKKVPKELPQKVAKDLAKAIEERSEGGLLQLSEVQIACLRLWQSSDPESLLKQKGVQGLLEDYLSDALNKFPDLLRDPAVALLSRLVTSSSVTSTGTRNVVSEMDLIGRVRDEEDIPEDILRDALTRLEVDAKLVRRERRYDAYFYEIVSEFLVPWISKQKEERRLTLESTKLRAQVEKKLIELKELELLKAATSSEREYINKVKSASPDELSLLLLTLNSQEARAMREYFGDTRYSHLRTLALRRNLRRSGLHNEPRGNVIVIHGFMGAELSAGTVTSAQRGWIDVFRLMNGWFDRLRLSESGIEDPNRIEVRASGILNRHYGELLLSLSQSWKVHTFWFDWRKDLNSAADALNVRIKTLFGDDTPVHLIAHSMGGLVARTFIKRYPTRWNSMWDAASDGEYGGRLIMLGTPNHGSFAIPQFITGAAEPIRNIAKIDKDHSIRDLLEIFTTFAGLYQMLPSPLVLPSAEYFYNSTNYGEYKVPQDHLDNALRHHEYLQDVIDKERMIYICGYNQPTFRGISSRRHLNKIESYKVTMDGDGFVSHELGILKQGRTKVPTYYVEENHGNLVSNTEVLKDLTRLLETGKSNRLSRTLPCAEASHPSYSQASARESITTGRSEEEARLEELIKPLREKGGGSANTVSQEGEIEEILVRGVLTSHEGKSIQLAAAPSARRMNVSYKPPRIMIDLVHDGIGNVHWRDYPTVDAISVGHYLGVKPQYAELALDIAISQSVSTNRRTPLRELSEIDLILTQYSERGTIRGELGQMFFMEDPRWSKRDTDCVIAVAGMGIPGRFGEPELAVLTRELCWSLGMMGKRHLATVLIGAGMGNLTIHQALSGWVRGIKNALSDSVDDDGRQLRRITFVEYDPAKIEAIDQAIRYERERLEAEGQLRIYYVPYSEGDLKVFRRKGIQTQLKKVKKEMMSTGVWKVRSKQGTRITVELNRNIYRYGAMTENTLLPMREVQLDPALVLSANQDLVAEHDLKKQFDRGKFVGQLLLPEDLRVSIYGNAPIVMMLDSTAARLHWEIFALPDREGAPDTAEFLAIGRGFTRQLRTKFAPPPEPPPPPRRVLRVLVIADPAEDAPLQGAQEEGILVSELFGLFNETYSDQPNTVEVVSMIGPVDASRTNVLRELMSRSYEVVHFAGHCMYDAADPESSGWVFTGGQRLTAKELNRIDRVPKFVFSNACEVGVTPERAELRSPTLAPTLAELFLGRGTSNFICPAWPVEGEIARYFALRLYSGLLGISTWEQSERSNFESLHEAMRSAREAIRAFHRSSLTWGAYQHYGNPRYTFFDLVTMERDRRAIKTARAMRPRTGGRSGATSISRKR
ncbi:MAG TPA: CHAT domain-containing protein [Blastocatellia bacterium]|nr:CHAT domain-containing protein [Blastocatellia bacterium]